MGFCAVEFVSKGICNADECRYNHVIEHSNLRKKKPETNENQETNHKRVCYKELLEKDSCPFGKDRCRFLHEFPESLRNDTDFIQKKLDERKMRQALCVNEYVRTGGCKKGGKCRFNHDITEEQRQNTDLQVKMKARLSQLSGHNHTKEKSVPETMRESNEPLSIHNISKEMAELRMIVMELRDKHF